MTRNEGVLLAALTIALSALTGLLYAGFARPAAELKAYYSGEPVNTGYSVGVGAPEVQAQVATPRPTSEWLQPGIDIPCDMAEAIARDAATHSCETLWAAERDDPHVQKALQIEPAIQVSRIHEFGRFKYMLFSQALIIWRNEGDDGRIGVFSPNGCWRGLPETLQPPKG